MKALTALILGAGLSGLVQSLQAAESLETDPVLQIIVSGSTRTVTRLELEKEITPAELTVYSPVYQRPMTYQGFWLDQVLKAVHVRLSDQDVVFEASDGYGTSLAPEEVGKEKWLLAYGEPGGWTPLPERNNPTFPGPWYVVGRDTSSYQEFPWPYEVVAIKIRADW